MGPTRAVWLLTAWDVAVGAYLLRRAVGDYGWRGCWRSPFSGALVVILVTLVVAWLP